MTDDHYQPTGVICVDVEATDLEGAIFAAAACAMDGTTRAVQQSWTGRCPIPEDAEPSAFVRDSILPALDDPITGIACTYRDYPELLAGWRAFYAPYRRSHEVVVHCGWPLDAKFLADAHADRVATTGPYPLLDIATALRDAGYNPRSVDAYLADRNISVVGPEHHPLHDAQNTLAAWFDLADLRRERLTRAAARRPWLRRLFSRNPHCPHHDPVSGTSWLTTVHVDYGRKMRQCVTCGRFWVDG